MKEITKTRKFGWLGNKKQLSLIKKLAINFSSLTILQIVNFIVPLLLIPYIINAIGMEKFGEIQFILVFTNFFISFNDFGYSLSAVKEISRTRKNHDLVKSKIGEFITFQILISLLLTIFYWVIVFSLKSNFDNFLLSLVGYLIFITAVYFPHWIFRGLERFSSFMVIGLISKLVYVVLILILVRSPSQYLNYPISLMISQLVLFILSWGYLIDKKYSPAFMTLSFRSSGTIYRKSSKIFFATLLAQPYTTLIPFFIGIILDKSSTGIYVVAEKVYKAFWMIVQSALDVLYPQSAQIFNSNSISKKQYLRKIIMIFMLVSLILIALSLIIVNPVIKYFFPSNSVNILKIYYILSFLIFIRSIGHIYLLQVLINLNKSIAVLKSVTAGLVGFCLSFWILVNELGLTGAALGALVPEIIVSSTSYLYTKYLLSNAN